MMVAQYSPPPRLCESMFTTMTLLFIIILMRTLKLFYSLLFVLSILLQPFGAQYSEIDSLDDHLTQYEQFNYSHYEDLLDDDHSHHHSHKHSEDGEEHEHHHSHTKTSNTEIQYVSNVYGIALQFKEKESKLNSLEKNLYSETHILEIFRPPLLKFLQITFNN